MKAVVFVKRDVREKVLAADIVLHRPFREADMAREDLQRSAVGA